MLASYCQANGAKFGLKSYTVNRASNISLLSKGRQDAITHALKQGCTHMLFLDDDMIFPENSLEILLSRKSQAIGVNYVRKNTTELLHVSADLNGQMVYSKGKSGIEEVGHVGMGIFLLDLAIIKSVPAPHFEVLWNTNISDYDSEDTYFCEKLRKHGVKIHVDHDLSQKVGHIGDYAYTLNSFG